MAATKAKRLLATLQRIGWTIKRQSGSHRISSAFHDGEEIGPRMLARISKLSGLKPEDL
jgi:predicted RNA binding protein YcfA (HicA-like mRNA interferase family)